MESKRVAHSSDVELAFRVINANDDADFTAQVYALAPKLAPDLLIIGVGPVSPALARDAQVALRSEGAHLIWIAPAGVGQIRLGLPDDLDDDTLERAYAAVEAAFPHLLDPRINVDVAPLPQVLALAVAAGPASA